MYVHYLLIGTLCVCIYIYICICVYIYIYMYIHIIMRLHPGRSGAPGRRPKARSARPLRGPRPRGRRPRARRPRSGRRRSGGGCYIYIYIYRER